MAQCVDRTCLNAVCQRPQGRQLCVNDFQHGLPEARRIIEEELIGKKIIMDKDDAFTLSYAGPQRVCGTILDVSYESVFVALVQFAGEGISKVTCASFMLSTTEWLWEETVARDDDMLTPTGRKHEDSMERPRYMASHLIRSGADLKGKVILGLEGDGTNRRAYEQAFDAAGIPVEDRPLVITVEMSPHVAFVQAMRFGRKHVRLSTGDFRIQTKRQNVCGIERAILLEGHDVISQHEKDNCVMLYLDYCGSPGSAVDFKEVYAKLPLMEVCGVTVAKRQPNREKPCAARLAHGAPPKEKFVLVNTYNHARVVCNVYARPEDKDAHEARLREVDNMKARHAASLEAKKRAAAVKRMAAATLQKNIRRELSVAAERCVGQIVHLDPSYWGGDPGNDFIDVKRVEDKLCFQVSRTLNHKRCALRAIMSNGTIYPKEECFWLTPGEVSALSSPKGGDL